MREREAVDYSFNCTFSSVMACFSSLVVCLVVLLVPLFMVPVAFGIDTSHSPGMAVRHRPGRPTQARREIFRSTRPVKTPAVPSTLRSSQFFRCDRQSHPPGLLGIVSAQKQLSQVRCPPCAFLLQHCLDTGQPQFPRPCHGPGRPPRRLVLAAAFFSLSFVAALSDR